MRLLLRSSTRIWFHLKWNSSNGTVSMTLQLENQWYTFLEDTKRSEIVVPKRVYRHTVTSQHRAIEEPVPVNHEPTGRHVALYCRFETDNVPWPCSMREIYNILKWPPWNRICEEHLPISDDNRSLWRNRRHLIVRYDAFVKMTRLNIGDWWEGGACVG